MADLKIATMPAPHDGVDLVSPPDAMSATRAPWMENFLVGNYGRLPVRGPVFPVYQSTSAGGVANKDTMGFLYDPVNKGMYVTRTTEANLTFAKVRPDEIPYRTAATKANLDTGTTETAHGNTVLAGTIYGRGATVNRTVWGFEYHNASNQDTQDAPVLNGPRQWKRRLAQLSNGAITTYAITAAPSCGVDVEAHNNLLWVLGGYPAAVTTEQWTSSCLFWTGTDLKADGTLSLGTDVDWRNANGVINRIEIPGDDEGRAIVRLGQNLAIFKQRSVWVLYGSDDDNYTLRNVTGDVGLWDRDSLVEADGGIYFRSQRGIEFFDGVSVSLISELIAPVFDDLGNKNPYQYRCSAGVVSNNYIEFRMRDRNNTAGDVYSCFILHRPTRNWTIFTGEDTFGYRAIYLRRGRYFSSRQWTFDTDRVESLSYHTFDDFAKASRANAFVIFRPIRPGGIGRQVQFQRAYLDTMSAAHADETSDETTYAATWTWEAFAPSTDWAALAPTDWVLFHEEIAGQAESYYGGYVAASKYWQGRKNVKEFFHEGDELAFTVAFSNGGDPNNEAIRAEIRGAAVEYQISQRRSNEPVRHTVPR